MNIYNISDLHVHILPKIAISDWLTSPSSLHNQPAFNKFSNLSDNILLDLDNSSHQTQPNSMIIFFKLASVLS